MEVASRLFCCENDPAIEALRKSTLIMRVVILETQQDHQGWSDIGVIRPGDLVNSALIDPRAHHPEPSCCDIWLHVPVVPGKAWLFGYTWPVTVCSAGEEEIVRVSE